MKTNIVLCLTLVLVGRSGIIRADETVAKTSLSTNAEPSLESLLSAVLPGKTLDDTWTGDWVESIQRLSPADRNRIAVAAARELSLRTADGDSITAATVDKVLYQPMTADTPTESALRRLFWRDDKRVRLLHHMENLRLISDARVIEPLINMLDCPGSKTSFRQDAADALYLLTMRGYPEQVQIYLYVDGENNPKRPQYVAWWRDWWAKNKNKHPVFDSEVEEMIKKRITAIEQQLHKDLAGYSEMIYLHPESIRITSIHPVNVVDVWVDSSVLGAVGTRTAPDGTTREAKEDDYIYLRITAGFGTPPFNPLPDDTPKPWQSLKEDVLREVLPGTDIVVTVQAASKDGEFVRQVRNSLAKLPPLKNE